MQVPLELSFRNVPRARALDLLLQQNVAKLEKICNHITSCRIVVEKPQRYQRHGNQYRVRIDITVPAGHEIVVSQDPGDNDMHDNLYTVVQNAFDAAQRKLKEVVERQRERAKSHDIERTK